MCHAHFPMVFRSKEMELCNRIFTTNTDWDPTYLKYIFTQDFYEFHELWGNSVGDSELVKVAEAPERYNPIIEDILSDDEMLYDAVAHIEEE